MRKYGAKSRRKKTPRPKWAGISEKNYNRPVYPSSIRASGAPQDHGHNRYCKEWITGAVREGGNGGCVFQNDKPASTLLII